MNMDNLKKRQIAEEDNRRERCDTAENWNAVSAASAHDCTGLIPGGSAEQGWLDLYHEIYPFGTPE